MWLQMHLDLGNIIRLFTWKSSIEISEKDIAPKLGLNVRPIFTIDFFIKKNKFNALSIKLFRSGECFVNLKYNIPNSNRISKLI